MKKTPTVLNMNHERLDHILKLMPTDFKIQDVPASVDLSPTMPPVYEQGQLESCTANALCALYSFFYGGFEGSRLYMYYNERAIEGTSSMDSGATPSIAVQSLYVYGLCNEKEWPCQVIYLTDFI